MKRFSIYESQINESLMVLLLIAVLSASVAEDLHKSHLKTKKEKDKIKADIEKSKNDQEKEKLESKLEKLELKRKIREERQKNRLARFQILHKKESENTSEEQRKESQKHMEIIQKTAIGKASEEELNKVGKLAAQKSKYSQKDIDSVEKKAKDIPENDVKEYVEKKLKTKEEPKKETPKEEPKKETPKEEPKKETPKETPKETVINPETGKKEKHVIHKGPRGGKYWNSDEGNKVYVESVEEDSRESIMLDRLGYLQWVIDNTKSKKDKEKLEEIYNALYNITWTTSGKLRSLNDIISYVTQTMQDNEGKIPGLPDEDQIEEIDKKTKSFKEIHPKEYESYIKRLEQSNLEKESDNNGESQADEILSPADTESEKDACKKLNELTDIYGFTNIIGLEPEKKPSKEDVQNKKDLKKDQKDNAMLQSKEKPDLGKSEETPEETEETPEETEETPEELTEETPEELTEDEINQLKELSKEELDEFLKDFTEEEKQQILDLIKESLYSNNTIFEKKTRVPTTWRDRESVVKDTDGSEIHARQKKNTPGVTYVRIKDGKEIGYATKKDFLKAKQNQANKKKNESFRSFSQYLLESVE